MNAGGPPAGGAAPAGGAGGRRRWAVLGGDQKKIARLRVERNRLGAQRCKDRLLHGEVSRRVLLDHRERAIALRAERFHRLGIERDAIAAHAGRQVSNDVPVRSRQNDHVVFFAAGGEQDAVLRIERQARASAASAREIVAADHLHRVNVNHCDRGLVFNVDVDFAVAVRCGLFRRAADVDGAENRSVFVVKHRDVGRRVAQDIEVVIVGVVQVAVGIALRRRSS